MCGQDGDCCSVIATSPLFPSLFSGKREYNALSSSPLFSSSLYPLIACCSFIPPILPSGAKEEERKKICCSFFTPLSLSLSPAPLWVTAAATTISFESAHAPLPATDRPTARSPIGPDDRAESAGAELFSRRHLVAAARREGGGHHVLNDILEHMDELDMLQVLFQFLNLDAFY